MKRDTLIILQHVWLAAGVVAAGVAMQLAAICFAWAIGVSIWMWFHSDDKPGPMKDL